MSSTGEQVLAAVLGAVIPILVAYINDRLEKRKPAEPAPYDQETTS